MSRKALVQESTGLVLNVIEIEPDANWTTPIGCDLVDATNDGGSGDTWDGEKFVKTIESIPTHAWWQK